MAIDFSQYKTAEAPIQPSSSQSNFNGLSNDNSLSAATLAPTQSISIPPAPPENATSSFGSELELLAKNTGTAKKEESQSFNDLLASLNAPGSAELTNQAYGSNNGVDQLQLELNDINSQILSEQEGLRRQIEEIENNAEGRTVSGVRGTIDQARRTSLRTQADLAVIQLSKQGRYDSAKAIADRAVTAILERQKNQQQLRELAYERSRDAFTKAEQREFETRQKERDRQLENEEYRLRLAFDAKIKQSDPLYQANLAQARMNLQQSYNDALPKRSTPQQMARMESTILDIKNLTNSTALEGAVGTTPLGRLAPYQAFTGEKSNFIAGVQKLTQQLTIEALQNAKQNGATFGALSEGELELLKQSASKINSWAIKDKSDNIVGYKTNAASFKKELDNINYYQKLDYLIKGGEPAKAGIHVTPDGRFWTENSDNSLSELIPLI